MATKEEVEVVEDTIHTSKRGKEKTLSSLAVSLCLSLKTLVWLHSWFSVREIIALCLASAVGCVRKRSFGHENGDVGDMMPFCALDEFDRPLSLTPFSFSLSLRFSNNHHHHHQQQQYDLSVGTFSPDGRVFQTDYAQKAVDNGG